MIYASVWGTMLLEWKNEVVVVKLFRSSDDGALDKDSIKSTQNHTLVSKSQKSQKRAIKKIAVLLPIRLSKKSRINV